MGEKKVFSSLPSVSSILTSDSISHLVKRFGKETVKLAAREILEELKGRIERGEVAPERDELFRFVLGAIEERVACKVRPGPVRVVNATGIVIHTNLGRAPMPERAIAHLVEVASRYSDLEFDLREGKRGSRGAHVELLLREIFGSEGALVVNNNAGAVLLVLSALARGREVVISRGELVEIGGGFRIPEIMAESGAFLVEVGTTNRTRVEDYERAFSENTAIFLKVHRSNFTIEGFTQEVSLEELVALGRKLQVPVVFDMGSGSVFDMRKFGFRREEGARRALEKGADLVTFSGDKLLGGPQAGIIVGRGDLIERLKSHPLARALRVDKLSLAALASLLVLYRDERVAVEQIPVLKMLFADEKVLRRRARSIVRKLAGKLRSLEATTAPDESESGGGALPGVVLPTWCVVLRSSKLGAAELAEAFRRCDPPLIGRVKDERFWIDLRTVFPDEDAIVLKKIIEVDARAG